MSMRFEDDLAPSLRLLVENLQSRLATDDFAAQDHLLAQRSIEELEQAYQIASELFADVESGNRIAAIKLETCLLLTLNGAHIYGALHGDYASAHKSVAKKNSEEARKSLRNNPIRIEEERQRDTAILLAVLEISDTDWDRCSNYTLAKSTAGAAGAYFDFLGYSSGISYKTVQRWIEEHVRMD